MKKTIKLEIETEELLRPEAKEQKNQMELSERQEEVIRDTLGFYFTEDFTDSLMIDININLAKEN